MESLETLRKAIRTTVSEWEKLPRMPSDWTIVSALDEVQDHYTLQMLTNKKDRYDTRLLAYLEIRDNKVWLLTDNTEEGIASGLLDAGLPKDQIVLGFYTPSIREAGEFAAR